MKKILLSFSLFFASSFLTFANELSLTLNTLQTQISALEQSAKSALAEGDGAQALAYYQQLQIVGSALEQVSEGVVSLGGRLEVLLREAREKGASPDADERTRRFYRMQFQQLQQQLQSTRSNQQRVEQMRTDYLSLMDTLAEHELIRDSLQTENLLNTLSERLQAIDSFRMPDEL